MELSEALTGAGIGQLLPRCEAGHAAHQSIGHGAGRLSNKTFGRQSLPSLLPAWTDLMSRAADDNVYYAPHYALALLDTVGRNQTVSFVTVWDHKTLIALLPVVRRPVPVPGLVAAGTAWETDHTYSCGPVLDRTRLQDAAGGLVDALSDLGRGEWVIPNMNLGGPTAKALMAALDERGAPWAAQNSFKRAVLGRGPTFEEHMQGRVASKRRRELARNRRRLEELGPVTHRSVTSGPELGLALSEFLRIEAGGWKGKRGTALASTPAGEAFARAVFGGNGRAANCRIDMLLLNGVPIAAGLIVFSGRTGFTVKNAYDEAYAAYSAGLLLEVEVLNSFLTEDWATRLDSGTCGSHVIDQLWPDSAEMSDVVFSLASVAPRARLGSYLKTHALRENSRSRLKTMMGR